MARFNGRKAVIQLDNASGVLTDFTAQIRTCTLQWEINNSTYANAGDDISHASTGAAAGTGTLELNKDTGAASLNRALLERLPGGSLFGESFTLDVSLPDAETGSENHAMEIRITEAVPFEVDGTSGDDAIASFSFAVDQTYTKSIIA